MSKLAHASTEFIDYETDQKHITLLHEDPEMSQYGITNNMFIAYLCDYHKPAYQISLIIIILANQTLLLITSIILDSRRNEQQ